MIWLIQYHLVDLLGIFQNDWRDIAKSRGTSEFKVGLKTWPSHAVDFIH